MVAGNYGLILVNRSYGASLVAALFRPNLTLWVTFGVTVALLTTTLVVPQVRDLFRFGPLHGHDLIVILAAAAFTVMVLEMIKALVRPLQLDIGSIRPAPSISSRASL